MDKLLKLEKYQLLHNSIYWCGMIGIFILGFFTADTYVTDNYKNAEIVRQKKYLAAIEDLKSDKVDAVVMDELPAKEIISSNNGLKILEGSLANDSYGMVVKKGNSELLNIINKVLNRLKEEGKIEEFVIKHTS